MMNKAYELAKAEIGTVEWAKGDNPKVVAYFKDAGHPEVRSDETAWCAAFVGAMLKRAGMEGSKALNARSYLQWGEGVNRDQAKPGDVVVFKRGNSTWQGHVAFFVKDNGNSISVLGGNQSNAVNVAAYQAAALLGIRRWDGDDAPMTSPAPAQRAGTPVAVPPVTTKPVDVGVDASDAHQSQGLLAALWRALVGIFRKGDRA